MNEREPGKNWSCAEQQISKQSMLPEKDGKKLPINQPTRTVKKAFIIANSSQQ